MNLEMLIKPVVESLGYEFVGLEYGYKAGYSIVRLYIDGKHNVAVEDCEKVSRIINSVLEVESFLKRSYMLEVSSPGMDRRLFTVEQCRKHVGKLIKLNLLSPKDGRRQFSGILIAVEKKQLFLEFKDENWVFDFGDVEQINIIPQW